MVNGLGQCVLGFVVILACSSFTNTLSEELNLAPDNIDIVNSLAVMGWKNLWNDPSGLSAICVAIFTALLYIVSRQQKAPMQLAIRPWNRIVEHERGRSRQLRGSMGTCA